jgi:hypothetical protein
MASYLAGGLLMTSFLVSLTLAAAAPVPKERSEAEFLRTVDVARGKAVRFLKEKQDADGGWESLAPPYMADFKGRTSALVAVALLEAGVPANDPAVAKAVEYLLTFKPEKTDIVGLQTRVLARVDAKKYAKQIQANADWLVANAITRDKKLQGWSCPEGGIALNYKTLFAVTGLHAAAQAGAKVEATIWPQVREHFVNTQYDTGGWGYGGFISPGANPTTTTNGLLALAIAAKYDKQAKFPNAAFEQGMALVLSGGLGEFGHAQWTFDAWMATAELGRALGSNEFRSGKLAKAWYREGAEKLLKEQQFDGSWKSGAAGIDGKIPVVATASGLYFLGPPAKK